MKKTIILLLLLPLALSAQWQSATVPTGAYASAPCAWYVPPNAGDTVRPLIIFFHGGGEAGADINRVLNAYLPARIKAGWVPQAVNPQTGKTERFIVIAAQEKQGTPWPVTMRYQIDWLMKNKGLKIDTGRVYTTGPSYGGAGSILYATWDQSAISVKAVASLSPMADVFYKQANIPALAAGGADIWFYTGSTDVTTTNATKFAAAWKGSGGRARVDIFTGGHDGGRWNDLYNEKIRHSGMNVYEWFLSHGKPPVYDTIPSIPPVDQRFIQLPHDPSRVYKILVLDKDGVWTEYDSTTIRSGYLKLEMK